jgi:hypothetical protein
MLMFEILNRAILHSFHKATKERKRTKKKEIGGDSDQVLQPAQSNYKDLSDHTGRWLTGFWDGFLLLFRRSAFVHNYSSRCFIIGEN